MLHFPTTATINDSSQSHDTVEDIILKVKVIKPLSLFELSHPLAELSGLYLHGSLIVLRPAYTSCFYRK